MSAFAVTNFNDFKSGYEVGDVATDFKLKNVDGKMVSLSNFKEAKGFIVIFTCNTCPFSIANEARINQLDFQFKTKGYPVIAINPNDPEIQTGESFEAMRERAEEKKFSFPYLYDESQEVHALYGATKTPHAYVIKKQDSELIVKYTGAIDDSVRDASSVTKTFVKDAVESLLAGKEVNPKSTKAIGCSVKA